MLRVGLADTAECAECAVQLYGKLVRRRVNSWN